MFLLPVIKKDNARSIFSVFLILSITFCCFNTRTFAQFDYLKSLSNDGRELAIRKICDSIYRAADSTKGYTLADNFISYAEKENNDSLALHIKLYKVFTFYKKFTPLADFESVQTELNNLLDIAIKKKFITVEINIRDVLADFYWHETKNYELALQEYNALNRIIERVSDASFYDKGKIYFHIGYGYFYFKDYVKSIEMFKQATNNQPAFDFQKYPYMHSSNNIGVAFREMNKMDSSDYYFNKIYKYALAENDSIWICILRGNIGENEYLKGNYAAAIPLLQYCVDEGIAFGDNALAAGSQMVLADIYYKQQNFTAAIAATEKAKVLVEKSSQYGRYEGLYPLLAKMYSIQGKAELAGNYIDSGFVVKDSLNRMFSGILMARALQKDIIGEQKVKLAEAENSKTIMNIKVYIAFSIALVILFTTLFVYRNKRKRHQQENELKDVVIKKSLTDLEIAQIQLKDFTRNVAEKNKLIETMEKQYGESNILAELEKTMILTGSDWRRFKDLFEQVNPGYLQRLTEKIPSISPAETRLLTLAKLNFSNKEMASALGITPQAIRVSWHRLRKKINIDDETTTMEELANMV